jgi:hypothetical protein
VSELSLAVSRIARWLSEVYALDLPLDVDRCVIEDDDADQLLPGDGQRTGVVILEEDDGLWLGLYVDPRDRRNVGMLVEETSHLLCVAQHALWERPVSLLALELQAEVDRFVFRRIRGGDPFAHFRRFRCRAGLDLAAGKRYRAAHDLGYRYCRRLMRCFPHRRDVPAMLRELRAFYRASPQAKLRRTAVMF